MHDELLKSAIVARELGMREETLCRWRKDGRCPAFIKDGRFIRYTRKAVEEFKTPKK